MTKTPNSNVVDQDLGCVRRFTCIPSKRNVEGMATRWLFASSPPSSVRPKVSSSCSCTSRRAQHIRHSSTSWFSSPVASTVLNIDRPPANKPKLSYVGGNISGAFYLAAKCIVIMRKCTINTSTRSVISSDHHSLNCICNCV